MIASETWLDLLADPHHLAFEVISDATFGIILYPALRWFAKRWVRRHDEDVHGTHFREI